MTRNYTQEDVRVLQRAMVWIKKDHHEITELNWQQSENYVTKEIDMFLDRNAIRSVTGVRISALLREIVASYRDEEKDNSGALEEFHRFTELPSELRLKIWRLTPGSQIIEIYPLHPSSRTNFIPGRSDKFRSKMHGQSHLRNIMLSCSEAYKEVKDLYMVQIPCIPRIPLHRSKPSDRQHRPGVIINCNTDTVFLNHCVWSVVINRLELGLLAHIKFLAIDSVDFIKWTTFPKDEAPYRCFLALQSLEKISIRHNDILDFSGYYKQLSLMQSHWIPLKIEAEIAEHEGTNDGMQNPSVMGGTSTEWRRKVTSNWTNLLDEFKMEDGVDCLKKVKLEFVTIERSFGRTLAQMVKERGAMFTPEDQSCQ